MACDNYGFNCIFIKSTNSCSFPSSFWSKVILILFSYVSFPLGVALPCPDWKIPLHLVLQALIKTKPENLFESLLQDSETPEVYIEN